MKPHSKKPHPKPHRRPALHRPSTETQRRLGRWVIRIVIATSLAFFFSGSLLFGATFVQRTGTVAVAWADVVRRAAEQAQTVIGAPAGPPGEAGPVWGGRERVNILLIGLDNREDESGDWARADTNMVVSIDPATGSAGILSIPRDVWMVYPVSGYWTEDRINSTWVHARSMRYPGGGPALAKRVVSYNLSIPIHFVAYIDFNGFIKVIDTLGGLTVDVPKPLKDNEYPTEYYGYQRIYFSAGLQHMDGERALIYARSRHQDSDVFRAGRQQQLMVAAREKALSLDLLPKLPRLMVDMKDTVQTDMKPAEILALARLAASIDTKDMVIRTVPSSNFITSQGASIQLIDRGALQRVMDEVFNRHSTAVD
ncbi:MAG: LCP family protein [Dehalococcoidia bacterium]